MFSYYAVTIVDMTNAFSGGTLNWINYNVGVTGPYPEPAKNDSLSFGAFFAAFPDNVNINVYFMSDPFATVAGVFVLQQQLAIPEGYVPALDAEQCCNGTAPKLHDITDEPSVGQVWFEYRAGSLSLYAVHTTACNDQSVSALRDCVQWVQVSKLLAAAQPTTTEVLAQHQTYGGDGYYRITPAIATDSAGNVLVTYVRSSSATNPLIGALAHGGGDPASQVGPEQTTYNLNGGNAITTPTLPDGTIRMGDYSMVARAYGTSSNTGCDLWSHLQSGFPGYTAVSHVAVQIIHASGC